MKRFKNILCYYHRQEDDVALKMAVDLARENQAKLTVMDVSDHLAQEYSLDSEKVKNSDILSQCKKQLEKVVEPYQGQGVKIKIQVIKGTPLIKLIQAVVKDHYDLLVTSTVGTKLRGLFWDSLALKLIRKCPVPVWIIKSKAGKRFKNILAAIDVKDDRYTNHLNEKILQMASSLALRHQGTLTVVHGWLIKKEIGVGITGHTSISEEKFQQLRQQVKTEKLERLKAIVSPYQQPGLTIVTKLIEKNPNLAIAETVEKTSVDLTVMGTLYRTGIAGVLMGNTAEETLPLLNSSLLAIKPDDFKSPIA